MAAIAALGGGEIAARGVAFLTAAWLARRLGPDGFGILGFATALASYFTLVVTGGLAEVGTRVVAREPGRAGSVYLTVAATRLALGAAALLALAVVASVLSGPPALRLVVLLSGLSFLSLAVDPAWTYRALERTGLAAAGQVCAQALVLGGVVALVSGPPDVTAVPVIQFAGEAAAAIVLAWPLARGARGAWRWRAGAAMFREASPVLVSRAMRTLIISFDMVLLGFLRSTHDVGLYAAAYRVCFLVLALAVALHTAYLPAFSRAAAAGPAALARITRDALAGAAIVGAPLVIGGAMVAGPLLELLFGAPYAAGADALCWLLLSLAFVFVHGILHDIYLVTARTGVEARWTAAAAATNVVANLWLIPRYGIAGAAAATALAEGVIAAGGVIAARLVPAAAILEATWRPVLAAAVMAALVAIVGRTASVPVQILTGGLAYVAMLVALMGPRAAAARLRLARGAEDE